MKKLIAVLILTVSSWSLGMHGEYGEPDNVVFLEQALLPETSYAQIVAENLAKKRVLLDIKIAHTKTSERGVWVRTLTGRTETVFIPEKATHRELIEAVAKKFKVSPEAFYLVHLSIRLPYTDTIFACDPGCEKMHIVFKSPQETLLR